MAQTDRNAGLVGNAAVKGPCVTVATSAITLAGLQSINSVTVAAGDRVLANAQANGAENGIYVADTGDWSRSKDANGAHDLVNGSLVYVTDGTETGWYYLSGATNPVAIGTDSLTFDRAGGALVTVTAFAQTMLDDISAQEVRKTLFLHKSGNDIASAATINLNGATGDFVDVTGTTSISAMTLADGGEKTLRFTGSLTLVHSGTLVLPGAANIQTQANDTAVVRGDSGLSRVISFHQYSRLGPDIASAAALPVGTNPGFVFDVTGTTTITSLTSKGLGAVVILQFDGALELTHSANLVLPGGTNRTTAAGDIWQFYEYAAGQWRGSPLFNEPVTVSSEVPIGAVTSYAGSSAPTGWLLCNGAAVSRTTYSDLFAVVGTTYGVGDGSTTFNVPDCTGRTVAGKEASATRLTSGVGGVDGGTLGAVGGAQSQTLTAAQMPAHTHGLTAATHKYQAVDGGSTKTATGVANTSTTTNTTAGTINGPTDSAGSGNAHPNVQPTIVLNMLIKH